ncbi:MAG: undecaprenyl-diphosphatase [Chlamydiales bacterium]
MIWSLALAAPALTQAAVTEPVVEGAVGPFSILLLAVVQGLAEFLPISSSGHLVLARLALGLREGGLALDVALHVGTLIATLWAYREQVLELIRDVLAGRFRFFLWMVLATIPVGFVGAVFGDLLERAFQSSRVAGLGLLATACILLIGERARKRHGSADQPPAERKPTWRDALVIGGFQILALTPGVSRSGTTISTGLVLGFSGTQAARLSFMISIPAILGAAILKLPDALESGFDGIGLGLVLGAVAVSALVGWLALRGLLLTLARGAFRWFAAYCVVVGVAVLVVVG